MRYIDWVEVSEGIDLAVWLADHLPLRQNDMKARLR